MKGSKIINIAPKDDQGSEAFFGFDFQSHCITRQCLEMIQGHETSEIICEFHEDFTELKVNGAHHLCQVKKREVADTLTIASLIDPIGKLIKKAEFKDVGLLVIFSHGRPSLIGDHSLANLIALLDRPNGERDPDWETSLGEYLPYFSQLLPEIDLALVQSGLPILKFCLDMPHPDAIESENQRLTAATVFRIWGVDISASIADAAYGALYKIVWMACNEPKQPRSVKTITAGQARETIRQILEKEQLLAENQITIVDTHSKLIRGKLDKNDYLIYALQTRMDARQVKFELDLSSTDWRNYKDEIAVFWESFQASHPDLTGALLWRELRSSLFSLGNTWSKVGNNELLNPHFAEGVFFDMLAICEADLVA
ncbi:MAG: dsDNA nuclease domain-containing protein [Anaerolineaceae bacterium]|nr:dsDNA nuclease domain-containing protein [Anaerolineaceae bacterium]